MATVTWSPRSLDDLEAIVRDLTLQSPQAAADLAESAIGMSDLLIEYPLLGRIFSFGNREDLRWLMVRGHRLIYRVQDDDVEIARIIHGARRIGPSDLPL